MDTTAVALPRAWSYGTSQQDVKVKQVFLLWTQEQNLAPHTDAEGETL